MTKVDERDRCVHCKAPLERPTPRTCPVCGGSLQRRYLTSGCLTSKPLLVLASLGIGWMLLR